jgi:hypothetical protein
MQTNHQLLKTLTLTLSVRAGGDESVTEDEIKYIK